MTSYAREEVEPAWQHYIAVGDSGDWNQWAKDLEPLEITTPGRVWGSWGFIYGTALRK